VLRILKFSLDNFVNFRGEKARPSGGEELGEELDLQEAF